MDEDKPLIFLYSTMIWQSLKDYFTEYRVTVDICGDVQMAARRGKVLLGVSWIKGSWDRSVQEPND